jgi:hypothetical protein
MEFLDKLISLRQYCRQHEWPRLPQWNYWITTRKPVAVKCVKKIGGRYMLDIVAFQSFIQNASIEE